METFCCSLWCFSYKFGNGFLHAALTALSKPAAAEPIFFTPAKVDMEILWHMTSMAIFLSQPMVIFLQYEFFLTWIISERLSKLTFVDLKIAWRPVSKWQNLLIEANGKKKFHSYLSKICHFNYWLGKEKWLCSSSLRLTFLHKVSCQSVSDSWLKHHVKSTLKPLQKKKRAAKLI